MRVGRQLRAETAAAAAAAATTDYSAQWQWPLTHRTGADLLAHLPEHREGARFGGGGVTQHEARRAVGAQRLVEAAQRVVQPELHGTAHRPATLLGLRAADVERDHGPAGSLRRPQSGVVVEAQVLAEPDHDRAVALQRRQIAQHTLRGVGEVLRLGGGGGTALLAPLGVLALRFAAWSRRRRPAVGIRLRRLIHAPPPLRLMQKWRTILRPACVHSRAGVVPLVTGTVRLLPSFALVVRGR